MKNFLSNFGQTTLKIMGVFFMKRFVFVLLGILIFGGCAAMPGGGPMAASLLETVTEQRPVGTPINGGSFSTKYEASLKNRTINLQVSARTLDGTVIEPGEVFSFNEIIGKATWAKGYRPAKIFIKGKEEQGLGGGICQLSSTLYNAADYAGMEIVERHPHSKRVYYVEEGRDAATAYKGVDLKFKNPLPYPVMIVTKVDGGEVTVGFEAIR